MADVLGAASVVLSVTGEGELSADLAAAVARLELVEEAANSARSAASKVAEVGGAESMGAPSSGASLAGTSGRGPRGTGPGGGAGGGGGGGAGIAAPANKSTAGGGSPGGSSTAIPVAVTNRPLVVRVEGPVAIKAARQGAVGSGAGMGVAASVAAGAGVGPGGVAGIGDGLRGATNDTKGLKEQMASLGSVMSSTFATGTASIFGLVAAADPSMFSTFQSSVRLAAIEVGQAFVPYVESAARGLQQFAGWFGTLDAGTKGTIAKIALATTVIAGVGVAAKVATVAFGGLSSSVVGVGRAMSLGLLSNPVTAGILGVTTLVGGLAAAWWGVSKAVDAAGSGMGRAGNQRVGGGGPGERGTPALTAADIALLPDSYRKQFEDMARRERAALNEDARRSIESERQRLTRAYYDDTIAQRESLPADVRNQLAAAPNRTVQILAEQERKLAEEADVKRLEVLNRANQQDKMIRDREAAVEKVINSNVIQQEYRSRVAAFARRRDTDIPAAVADMFRGARSGDLSREFEGLRAIVLAELERAAPGMKFTEDELTRGLAPDDPNPKLGQQTRLVARFPRPDVQGELAREVSGTQAAARAVSRLLETINTPTLKNGFKQDLKLPFQSHYTTFDAYQESLQIKALDGNTAQTAADINAMRNTLERMKEGLDRGITASESTAAVLKILQGIFGN